eukprot:Pgem_evm1s1554
MIASTLIDVPNHGAYVYGGHAVYDTDAKRFFIGVRVPNVYSIHCARQMARGALVASRAMVSLAVTGKAGPVGKDELESLGVVDYATTLRARSAWHNLGKDVLNESADYVTSSHRINLCGEDGRQITRDLCKQYKQEAGAHPKGYASKEVLEAVRMNIRVDTVLKVLERGTKFLKEYCGNGNTCPYLESIQETCYDSITELDGKEHFYSPVTTEPKKSVYTPCGEPSRIISQYLNGTARTGENLNNGNCEIEDHVGFRGVPQPHCSVEPGKVIEPEHTRINVNTVSNTAISPETEQQIVEKSKTFLDHVQLIVIITFSVSLAISLAVNFFLLYRLHKSSKLNEEKAPLLSSKSLYNNQ